jgi:hypothetical protein
MKLVEVIRLCPFIFRITGIINIFFQKRPQGLFFCIYSGKDPVNISAIASGRFALKSYNQGVPPCIIRLNIRFSRTNSRV